MSDCTCYVTPEKYWTRHYGAVEPGSQMEPNPDCPEHFPKPAHQCEAWMVRRRPEGGRYCAACGADKS